MTGKDSHKSIEEAVMNIVPHRYWEKKNIHFWLVELKSKDLKRITSQMFSFCLYTPQKSIFITFFIDEIS